MVVILDNEGYAYSYGWNIVVEKIENTPKMKSVSSGFKHSVLVDINGFVWVIGNNNHGQLGVYGEGVDSPIKLENVSSIHSAICGLYSSFLLTEEFDVIAFGENSDGQLGFYEDGFDSYEPKKVENLPKIKSVVGKISSSLFLDFGGNVWAIGDDYRGGLGIEPSLLDLEERRLRMVPNLPYIVSIHSMYAHTVLIDCFGKAWSFGSNDCGELGLGDYNDRCSATCIDSVENIFTAACGNNKTALVSKSGSVWVCGNNNSQYLGINIESNISVPTLLDGIPPISSVKFDNYDDQIMLTDTKGYIWVIMGFADDELCIYKIKSNEEEPFISEQTDTSRFHKTKSAK